jgi:hypothetical protein
MVPDKNDFTGGMLVLLKAIKCINRLDNNMLMNFI